MMRERAQRFLVRQLLVLALGVVLPAPILAAGSDKTDSEEPEIEGLFGEAIDVNVVNVEVYVTDKDGRPVTGLAAEDFEVFENRRPMEITNFYAVENGARLTESPDVAEIPTDGFSERKLSPIDMAPLPESERLRLVIYVDNFNIRPGDRKRIMGQLNSFILRTIRGDDQVALFSYDRALKMRHPFTHHPELVADAVEELLEVRAEGSQYDRTRAELLKRLDRTDNVMEAASMIRPYADSVLHDVSQSIEGLKGLVDFLAGLPGRKMVLHVSSGIQMVAAADLFTAVQDIFDLQNVSVMSEFHIYDTSHLFEELTARANANGVTFYTLDAGGLRANTSRAAEFEGLNSARASLSIDSEYEANLQNALFFIAKDTGGSTIVNQNNVTPALEKVAADFRNYYSLGYTPDHSGDGRFYNVDVKVKKKGLVVRHREGYRDKSTRTKMTDGTRAALYHVFEDNPLGVEIAFGEPEWPKKNTVVMPIQVRIPVGKLVLFPTPDGSWVARVRLFVAAMDGDGGVSEVQETPLSIKIPGHVIDEARGEYWLYNHKLLMRRGRQKVALGIRDELGAVSSFLSRTHRIQG